MIKINEMKDNTIIDEPIIESSYSQSEFEKDTEPSKDEQDIKKDSRMDKYKLILEKNRYKRNLKNSNSTMNTKSGINDSLKTYLSTISKIKLNPDKIMPNQQLEKLQ